MGQRRWVVLVVIAALLLQGCTAASEVAGHQFLDGLERGAIYVAAALVVVGVFLLWAWLTLQDTDSEDDLSGAGW